MNRGVFIAFLVLIVLFSFRVGAIRINEVELNPTGEDSGNEWIELYSPQEVNITGWVIENVKGKNVSLNGSFPEFRVITMPYNFLTNDKQKLKLFNDQGELVDETDIISDSNNDERSWQYCGEWVFRNSTRSLENDCEEKISVNNGGTSSNQEIEDSAQGKIDAQEASGKEDKTIADEVVDANLPRLESAPEPIKLVPKDIKTWNSQEARIKRYVLYGFTLFCLVLLIILIKWQRK